MQITQPGWLALLLLLVPFIKMANLRRSALGHTSVNLHANVRSVSWMARVPQILHVIAWLSLCLAMTRPVYVDTSDRQAIETRDFIISIDISGSMETAVPRAGALGRLCDNAIVFEAVATGDVATTGDQGRYSRLDAAIEAAQAFVACREGDRVGLLPFAEKGYNSWPLTTDLQIIHTKLALLGDWTGSGTNFDGPTSPTDRVGAIQSAINHFRELGQSRTLVLVMVTDGEDSIVTRRFAELQRQLRQLNVHMYVLGVGEQWITEKDQDLRRFAEELGGLVIPVVDSLAMQEAFDTINRLEQSIVYVEQTSSYREAFSLFISAAAIAWMLYLAAAALIREEI